MSGYLTVDQAIENAPNDLQERDVEGVFGGKVKIKALTAHQAARVKQKSISLAGRSPDVAWAEMEKAQFELGVIEPKFTAKDVEKLHRTSGASFAKVIAELDEISGLNKEELRKAQESFPEPEE